MIGILLVTHGHLATEMIKAMEHVIGQQTQIDTVCIEENDDVEAKRQEIVEKVKALDSGDGVCITTDMFGGTPSNLAISVMQGNQVEVIAGLNLPMLIKLVRSRDLPLEKAAVESADAARKYINIASELLKNG